MPFSRCGVLPTRGSSYELRNGLCLTIIVSKNYLYFQGQAAKNLIRIGTFVSNISWWLSSLSLSLPILGAQVLRLGVEVQSFRVSG